MAVRSEPNARFGLSFRISLLVGALIILACPAYSQSLADLVEKARPSVAFVFVRLDNGGAASGSAFVVDSAGYLITALHVVAEAREVSVLLPGDQPQHADVLGVDVADDLAMLHIPQTDLVPLALTNLAAIRPGQDLIVLGYPLANVLAPSAVTVTRGIVSAVRPPLVQVDAAVNPGNSGGPVLDTDGHVIGVADSKVVMRGVEGLNFAISADAVKQLVSTALDSTKAHTPLALPLTVTKQVELSYESGGIGSRRIDQLAVSCALSPPGALSFTAIQAVLQTPQELNVITWLSFEGGAALGSQGTFGYLGQNGPQVVLRTAESENVSPPPKSICLNFAAERWRPMLVGLTFKVTYELSYRIWSRAIAP
jgi:S1-C subfamily serine protease